MASVCHRMWTCSWYQSSQYLQVSHTMCMQCDDIHSSWMSLPHYSGYFSRSSRIHENLARENVCMYRCQVNVHSVVLWRVGAAVFSSYSTRTATKSGSTQLTAGARSRRGQQLCRKAHACSLPNTVGAAENMPLPCMNSLVWCDLILHW